MQINIQGRVENQDDFQNENILKQIESILGNQHLLINDPDSLTWEEQLDESLESAKPEANEHESIQNNYIWFAAYNHLVSESEFTVLINSKSYDIIKNTTTIELKDYDVGYFKLWSKDKQLYLFPNPGSICLVKLYLITKQQFILISNKINKEFNTNLHWFMDSNIDLFWKPNLIISKEIPYGAVVKLGVWEKYEIFCLTNSVLIKRPPVPHKVNVFSEEVKRYYYCLKQNFPEFSENYLIYYIKSKLRISERQGDSFRIYLLNGIRILHAKITSTIDSPVAKLKQVSRNNGLDKKNKTEQISFNQNNINVDSNLM